MAEQFVGKLSEFKDGDRRVRESAARSFLELGLRSREAVAILAASKDDPWVYAVTLAFLVRSGGPEAGPFVVEGIRGTTRIPPSPLLQ